MSQWSTLGVVVGGSIVLAFSSMTGCGSNARSGGFPEDDEGGVAEGSVGDGTVAEGSSSGADGTSSGINPDAPDLVGDGAVHTSSGGDGGVVCPKGLTCSVACPPGQTTTISGTVYDPAMQDPLYNVAVYVPAVPLQPLPAGVPTGADACSCAALYKSGAVVSTVTGVDGKFTLANAPVGSNVPLVLQVGKWRHVVTINTVTQCQDNPQPDKSLALNGTVAAGSDDNIPDIAVSTGHSDTLECLLKRIGLPDSEYVAGPGPRGAANATPATPGHIHIFSGGNPNLPVGTTGGTEVAPMPGAPESDTNLWDMSAHLMPYDILLLSCEGAETYDANPGALETYLNAGGRAFASHFHYQWFNGSANGIIGTPPTDWGNNLATWAPGAGGGPNPGDGVIVQTLNVGGGPFAKGVALDQWLTNLGALGGVVPAGDLAIYQSKFNAVVTAANTPSQPWITMAGTGGGTPPTEAMYFSFDTPVGGLPATDGGADGGGVSYCGRAVYSDLHVDSNVNYTPDIPSLDTSNDVSAMPAGCGADDNPCTFTATGQPPPQGCAANSTDGGPGLNLSPQEKALEFMLFDLSSCVLPDTITPPSTPIAN